MACRSETGGGTLAYVTPESWNHVEPLAARLLELETEIATADAHSPVTRVCTSRAKWHRHCMAVTVKPARAVRRI